MNILKKLRQFLASTTQGTWLEDEDGFVRIEDQAQMLVDNAKTDNAWAPVCMADSEGVSCVVALAHPTNIPFINLAHNAMPLLLNAVDELEDAVRELTYLKPEKFDDDEHRTNWESSLNRKLEVLAMLKGEVANG